MRTADERLILDTYAGANIELDEAGLESELVAEATEKIINDKDGRLVRYLLGHKQKGLIYNLMTKLGRFLARKKADKEGRLEAYDAIEEAYERLKDALKAGAGEGGSADVTVDLDAEKRRQGDVGKVGEDGQVQFALVNPGSHYDYSKPFAQQFQDWKDGKIPPRGTLLVSRTPDVLKNIGFSNLPITIDQKHMRKIFGDPETGKKPKADHDLGDEFMAILPQAIANPVAIIENREIDKRTGSLVKGRLESGVILVFSQKNKNANDQRIMGAISITSSGAINGIGIDTNGLKTTHSPRDLTESVRKAVEIEKSGGVGVYYVNKKTIPLLEEGQSQVLGGLKRNGFLHSILDADSPVNAKHVEQTETKQFVHWFDKSKVVDEEGKPLIVYHGMYSDFDVFDMSKGRRNMDIQGAFFTPYKEDAEGYGPNVGDFYSPCQNDENDLQ